MRAARAPFLILVQGDMLMTQPGWNVALTVPLRQWDDVFSVSARCAHGFDNSQRPGPLTGAKCYDPLTPQPAEATGRCIFHVRLATSLRLGVVRALARYELRSMRDKSSMLIFSLVAVLLHSMAVGMQLSSPTTRVAR